MSVLAGTKRKRYVPLEKDVSTKLAGKLHHGLKDVRKAVKKAKTFETQRLVKKLKDIRKPGRDLESVSEVITDLEAQLESLKRIEQERIAHLALSSKIRKDKTLSSNDALLSALASSVPSTTEANPEICHAKVESRLLSSKILAGEVSSVLAGLKAVLDPALKVKPSGALRTKTEGDEGAEAESSDDDIELDVSPGSGFPIVDVSTEDDGASEEGGLDDVVDEDADMVDDGGWESGSIDNGNQVVNDSSSRSSTPPPKRSKHPTAISAKAASPHQVEPEAASTFLPSLSVGFIKGDPDSEFDESEEEAAESGRKNRRGQRARQAIWEKKYGKNAKHVKKQQEDVDAAATAKRLGRRLDSGWGGQRESSLKHVQTSAVRGKKPPRMLNRSHGGGQGNETAERPTHPSWEAKKKLKEKEGAKILPSQGKKIVFA